MNKIKKSYNYLIGVIGLNFIIRIFIDIFLVSHLLGIADLGVYTVSIFYMITYAVMTPLFFAFSVVLKRINKLHILRLGIFMQLLFVLALILVNDYLLNNIVLVASLYGLAQSALWSSFNSIRSELVPANRHKWFNSTQGIIEFIIKIIVPVALGFLIDFSSFEYILFFILGVAMLQFAFTMLITNGAKNNQIFSIKNYYKQIKLTENSKIFRKADINYFIRGLTEIVPILVVYITVLTYKTNTSLGIITSIISLLCILTISIFNKFYKSEKHSNLVLVSAVIAALGLLPLLFSINKTNLIIFNILFSCFIIVPNLLMIINKGIVVHRLKLTDYIVENSAMAELFLNTGRVIGFSMLLFVGMVNSEILLSVLLGVSMLTIMLFGVSSRSLEKEVINIKY